jgi:ATP-dependent protease ClpP protease subunit
MKSPDDPSADGGAVPQETPEDEGVAARVMTLAGPIDWDSVARFADELGAIIADGPPMVAVQIASPGGNLMAGLAIHDLIATCPIPTVTAAFGLAGSAGALVFQAGVHRFMAPNARLMVHLGGVDVEATMNQEMAATLKKTLREKDLMVARIFAKRTGLPLKKVLELKKDEADMGAREAVRLGFADSILRPPHRPAPRPKKPSRRGKKGR